MGTSSASEISETIYKCIFFNKLYLIQSREYRHEGQPRRLRFPGPVNHFEGTTVDTDTPLQGQAIAEVFAPVRNLQREDRAEEIPRGLSCRHVTFIFDNIEIETLLVAELEPGLTQQRNTRLQEKQSIPRAPLDQVEPEGAFPAEIRS